MLRAEAGLARADLRPRRGATWLDLALVVAAIAVLLRGFGSIVEGTDWWFTAALVMLLTAVTCGVLRALGARGVAILGVLAVLLSSTWVFAAGTTFLGVPTRETLRTLYRLLADAGDIVIGEQAPVVATSAITFLLAASFGLLVVVGDVLLRRRGAPLMLGIVFVAVHVTPALVVGRTPPAAQFLAVSALWLVLLWRQSHAAGQRSRGGWRAGIPAAGLAVTALVAGVALPPVLPDVPASAATWGAPVPAVFGRGINPMLELGQNLRRSSPVVTLELTTTGESAPYLKVATLSDFSGRTWAPSEAAREDRVEEEIEIDPDIESSIDNTVISIRSLRSLMLPVPYPAVDVSGVKGNWRWERAGMTLRTQTSSRNQQYNVSSLTLEPTAEQMRDIDTYVARDLSRYVELPDGVPDVITDTARGVTRDAPTEYDTALALQSFLRGPDFAYSETAPVADGYDGNGLDVIAEFLDKRQGYCVHFSSTMSVMARSLGIPARVAVGFAPADDSRLVDGEMVHAVRSDQLHAWSELYFDGVGWLRFDPTPGIGEATVFAEPVGELSGSLPQSGGGGQSGDDPTWDQETQIEEPASAPAAAGEDPTVPRAALVVLPALLLVVAAPGALRVWRRRRRLSDGSPDALWREVEDTARDVGLGPSSQETPRGLATRLLRLPDVDSSAVTSTLERVERWRFAPPSQQADVGVDDVRRVRASVLGGLSRARRLLAVLAPRSVIGSPFER